MTLAPGTRLGRYQIHSLLGAGGMGEVYLARDTQLERSVAVKILPADLVESTDRVHRFVREARAASALNHPYILTVHEIGSVSLQNTPNRPASPASDVHYMAMEFVEARRRSRPTRDSRCR